MIGGVERWKQYPEQGAAVACAVDIEADGVASMATLIAAALGTTSVETASATASAALTARQSGLPHDGDRMRLFGVLIDALHDSRPRSRPVGSPTSPRYTRLPFYEAYFSNFIEGTQFELDEARALVYDRVNVPNRTGDSHDCSAPTHSSPT